MFNRNNNKSFGQNKVTEEWWERRLDQIIQSLLGPGKDFGFCSKHDRKPLVVFEKRNGFVLVC